MSKNQILADAIATASTNVSPYERLARALSGEKFLVPVTHTDGFNAVDGGLVFEVCLNAAAFTMEEAAKLTPERCGIHRRYGIHPDHRSGFVWATVCPPFGQFEPGSRYVLIEGCFWEGRYEYTLLETPMHQATADLARERMEQIRKNINHVSPTMYLVAKLEPVESPA